MPYFCSLGYTVCDIGQVLGKTEANQSLDQLYSKGAIR